MTITYLDAEIAGEGLKADLLPGEIDEETGEFQPVFERPHIPTYEGIKSIKHLFPQFSNQPYKHKPFPAWLYHASQKPKLVRTPEAAKALGVAWNKAEHRFDCTGEWQAKPVVVAKANHAGPGKHLMEASQTRAAGQSEMIGAVVAAVMAQMGAKPAATGAPASAPNPALDPEWVEFQAFKAWKEQQALLNAATMDAAPEGEAGSNKLTEAEERELLIEAAAERDVEIEPTWSLDRIKEELDKVA